jgi:hypothetical protein
MLRNFVGDGSGFSESDLSTCLRQSGYVVEVAAERLMTGQYQPSQKKQRNEQHHDDGLSAYRAGHGTTSSSQSATPQHLAHSSTRRSGVDTAVSSLSSSASSSSAYAAGHSGTYKTPSQVSKRNHTSISSSSSAIMVTPKATPGSSTPHGSATAAATCDNPSWKDSAWLLCQRWVSDGVNLQRNGSCNYQEELRVQDLVAATPTVSTEAAANATPASDGGTPGAGTGAAPSRPVNHGSLRFRSSHIQGHFPRYLATMMSPLLRANLIRLEAVALMEERNLNIGAQVAFSLR